MFPLSFLVVLIVGALAWTVGSALALLLLLARDWSKGRLW